ncbi:MAG: penicillin-binding protein 2 [Candidatus Nomurabacteria bacterium]
MGIQNNSKSTPTAHVERSIHRMRITIFFALLLALIVIFRAFYIQIIKHNYYISLADKQYISTMATSFDRGTIFLSHHNGDPVPAAQLITKYRIAIDPTIIVDKDNVYNIISSYITLDKQDFLNKANKVNDPYEEIAKDIGEDVVAILRTKKIKGVSFVKDSKRSYPQDDVGAKVFGFVGNNGVRVGGQYGVEKYYDDVLSRDSLGYTINFFAELFTDVQKTVVSNQNQEEGDVVLTIDAEVQRALHSSLVETKKQWESDIIGGIIMDPQTGAILAMDSLPSFNPNKYGEVEDPSLFGNQLVSGVFEMGSIIKPITIASALDAGVITEDTTYDDTGFRMLNGFKVKNFDSKPRGPNTSIQTILDKSLNVGIVFVVEKLGSKKLSEYFKKFGIGEDTGIDLPGEATGLTKNLDSNILVDSATSGFGQGIAITPIQTVRALATLGNGGILVNPHVVDTIIYKNGNTKKVVANTGTQVITKETSEKISRMLVHIVDTALANGARKMDHYSIAAKTGTAQMVKPGGGYYDDRYLHSFVGYFPAYDAKYVIFLFHTYPKGAEFASATLTEPFFKMVKFLISYYEVPPDR